MTEYDIECMHKGETCWFSGNLDRLDEYQGSYRLKGTRIYVCEVCFDNDRTDVSDEPFEEEESDEPFEQEEEEE